MLSTSFTWWDKSKPGSAPTSPAVVTRLIPVAVPKASITPMQAPEPPQKSLKRKRAEQERRQKKKSRASSTESSTPPPIPSAAPSRKRVSKASGARPSPTPSTSRASAGARPNPSTSEAIYRHSRSRSASVLRASDEPIPRDCYLEADAGRDENLLTCEKVFREYQKSYKTHFTDPDHPEDNSWEPHETNYPVAELEFPNTGATERYILLAPKDKDHYSPMLCLERALHAIIECYLTPEQQTLFGPMPTTTSTPEDDTHHANHLRTLHRAVVKKDGPLFLSTLAAINKLLQSLKYPLPDDPFAPAQPNALKEAVRQWTPTGLPWQIVQRVIEETYQRTVGPRSDELRKYEAFSSTTYGELMPSLVAQILKQTRLKPGMLFLDLGSGVGNVVLQAALQCGCDSFGIEIKAGPAELAREQHRQLLMRAAMWGVNVGNVELVEGDMLENGRVNELLRKADVVLVNNKVFDESLNAALRPKFLDLKDGAIVISLRPFVQPNARMTERNIDDISTIFDVTQHEYHSMDVSWDCKGGSYYIHRVDRAGYAAILAQFELASSRSTRGRR